MQKKGIGKEAKCRASIEKYGKQVKYWTKEEEQRLAELFPDTITVELCDVFERSKVSIYNKAKRMGLEKSDDFKKRHGLENFHTVSGTEHWNYGQIRPEETKKKIREGHFPMPLEQHKFLPIGKGSDELKDVLQELEIKFETQEPLFGYVVDFFLPDYQAVIEVDGKEHRWGQVRIKDGQRDDTLHQHGIAVWRVDSNALQTDPSSIGRMIAHVFLQKNA